MTIAPILDKLADGINLEPSEAKYAMTELMDGHLSPAQAGALLLTLRAKGETAEELAAAVEVCLSRAVAVTGIEGEYIDIVGTGGDGKHSFNCSTCTALILAGMGYQVLKHGNRAVSSSSGAADALECVGYPLNLDPEGIKESLKKSGFAFCLAPHYHPGFKNIVPIRRELGVRTLFNLLGPMINPSRPTHMMMGVAKPEMVDKIARVLALGGYRRALVIHGAGGYDEATAFGPVTAALIEEGEVKPFRFDPADYGFTPPASEDELRVETREEAEAAVRSVLSGQGTKAMNDMVTINLSLALSLLAPELDMQSCVSRARMAVAQGVAMKVIAAWQQ